MRQFPLTRRGARAADSVPGVSPEDLIRRLDGVQVVDVRFPNEWEAGRIEGARHIPVDDLADRIDELDAGRPVVAVCRSGERSRWAVDLLRGEGIDAESLEGGMEAWAAAGLALRAGDGGPGVVAEPEPPPDDRPEAHRRIEAGVLELIFAASERFGGREPSDEEMRGFLRERLLSEGRTPEEADEVLARMAREGS